MNNGIKVIEYIELKCVKCNKVESIRKCEGTEDIERYGDELNAAKAKHDKCFA